MADQPGYEDHESEPLARMSDRDIPEPRSAREQMLRDIYEHSEWGSPSQRRLHAAMINVDGWCPRHGRGHCPSASPSGLTELTEKEFARHAPLADGARKGTARMARQLVTPPCDGAGDACPAVFGPHTDPCRQQKRRSRSR
jgi:hypothetical protein